MIHRAEAHLLPDVLPESNHRYAEHASNLVQCLLFLLLVFSADVHHLLYFEYVAGAGVRAGLHHEGEKLSELGVLND